MDYYLLVDCNNFFVSCERVFRPDLNGKPVIVLSSNDGCVIARSNEAKALGIAMGVPYFKIQQIVRKEKCAVFSSNHILYSDFSKRVMSLIRQVSPAVEVYSIDEAFIDMRGIDNNFDIETFAKRIRKLIFRGCGIPVSIGVAPTKTLAKLAAKLVKSSQMGGEGVCVLNTAEIITKALSITSIGDIWGIGRKSFIKLRRNGIESALDYINTAPTWIKMNLTISGYRIWQELNSISAIDFINDEEDENSRQSIMVSRSFTKEINNFDELSSALANFVNSACQRLRSQNSATHQITVFVHTNRFSKVETFYNDSIIHYFEVATDNLIELTETSTTLLKTIYRSDSSYKKVGVILTKLIPRSKINSNLFDEKNREKQNQLMNTIEDINIKFGKNSIVSARRGFGSIPVSGQNISPCYTSQWSDILVVKI